MSPPHTGVRALLNWARNDNPQGAGCRGNDARGNGARHPKNGSTVPGQRCPGQRCQTPKKCVSGGVPSRHIWRPARSDGLHVGLFAPAGCWHAMSQGCPRARGACSRCLCSRCQAPRARAPRALQRELYQAPRALRGTSVWRVLCPGGSRPGNRIARRGARGLRMLDERGCPNAKKADVHCRYHVRQATRRH